MVLSDLETGAHGTVDDVHDAGPDDIVARRLRDLGFVPGETVRLVTRAPLGGDPLLVQVGFTRFAMRRQEAARVKLQVPGA
ncbi:MAG: iron transporter [Arenimonas sp. SCN 70-307]|uniref:FeoA family protein n=1 Tax=Arenimonas sp. SCN 70-307 TaxID=1660089 RepID=UPI00086DA767|nr:FeoA family protein [Arenimonas sp. SCN 70-307]ODS64941.1 MAG: iron transporter [Arenimonas sp. SCN 70-307]